MKYPQRRESVLLKSQVTCEGHNYYVFMITNNCPHLKPRSPELPDAIILIKAAAILRPYTCLPDILMIVVAWQ